MKSLEFHLKVVNFKSEKKILGEGIRFYRERTEVLVRPIGRLARCVHWTCLSCVVPPGQRKLS